MREVGRHAAGLFLLCALLTACSAPESIWRSRTTLLIQELERYEAQQRSPQEYRSLLEAFEHGEALFHVRENDSEAAPYYQLSLQKGEILLLTLQRDEQKRVLEQQQRSAEAAAQAENAVRERAAAEAEKRKVEEQAAVARAADAERSIRKVQKEQSLSHVTSYTVRRGETLPQISGRSEIYGDASLWPIIYRANRDQIRDPKRLWSGQVLTIPRNFSRDEIAEARRYSGRK